MKLHVWRAINRKTQAWVATACKCSTNTISQIENGKRPPGFNLLMAIEALTNGEVLARDFVKQPAEASQPAAEHEGAA
jgi:transcriptional regulator with XRE-family HTH domain